MKIFPQFLGSNINIVKKRFFQKVRHLVVIYTPKEAPSRIFVTGGQYARDKCWQKNISISGRPACTCMYIGPSKVQQWGMTKKISFAASIFLSAPTKKSAQKSEIHRRHSPAAGDCAGAEQIRHSAGGVGRES